jgi:SNF2 family DNA or RNA helicase
MVLYRENLHKYQISAIEFIKQKPSCFCILGMGLGKTVITLTAISDLYEKGLIRRVVVICPLRVGRYTWPSEIALWGHLGGLTYAIAIGSEKERARALDTNATITIVNRENTKWLVNRYREKWPYDMVVIDESTSFKNQKSERFKWLRRVRSFFKRVVLLTGTPTPTGLLDLWPQVYLLDGGQRLEKGVMKYREMYFREVPYGWEPRRGAEDTIYQKISDITISLKPSDYIDMPDRVNITIPVHLTREELDQYASMKSEYILQCEGQQITAANAAVLANKLQQLANGAIYSEKGFVVLHDAKLEALCELVEGAGGEPIIVAYAYQHDYERIKRRFPEAVDIRDGGSVDRWNSGLVRMLLAHPLSAGHGLNLQKGGSILIWFGLPWSLELYEQMNCRIYRQGQLNKVRIYDIIADKTIDNKIQTVLRNRENKQEAMIEYFASKI